MSSEDGAQGPAPAPRPAGAGYSRAVRWLKIGLPLLALALLSTIFLVPREVSFEGGLVYTSADLLALGEGLAVTRPRILLADEPTGNLDPDLSRHIMELFARFNQVGSTVIVATHDIALIETMGLRTLGIEQGRVVTDVTAEPIIRTLEEREEMAADEARDTDMNVADGAGT